MNMKVNLLFLFSFLPLLLCSCSAQPDIVKIDEKDSVLANYVCEHCDMDLEGMLDSFKINKSEISILIDKSDYRLYVMYDTSIVKDYPVVFGFNPTDDKLREGDGCTPEGSFTIFDKYPHASWSKFIWINYPTTDSWRKHRAAKCDSIIDQNAAIGGEIGIHGVPKGTDFMIDMKQNWTLGCIALKNKDVNELYPYITKSTEIVIRR
jgi:murein L,D-transpeptidase YafK